MLLYFRKIDIDMATATLSTLPSHLPQISTTPIQILLTAKGVVIAKLGFFLAICALIVVLNVTEIILICRKKTKKNHEYLLLGLSTSDTILGLSFFIYRVMVLYINNVPVTPIFVIFFFSVCSSVFNILAISLERLFAILYPLRHRAVFTKRKLLMLVCLVWTLASLLTLTVSLIVDKSKCRPPDGHEPNEVLIVAPFLFIVDFVYVVIYFVILRKLWTIKSNFMNRAVSEAKQRRERNSIFMCALIAFLFVLLTAPTAIGMTFFHATPIWSRIPYLLNSVSNSVVYFFLGRVNGCKISHKKRRATFEMTTTSRSNFRSTKN